MTKLFSEVLKIDIDGVISINEAIVVAIALVVLLIILVLLKKPVVNFFTRNLPGRKKTIFSHRKNPYKTSIGKKRKNNKKKK